MSETILPSVDDRISAWIELKRKKAEEDASEQAMCITISREFGCEAYPVAVEVQKMLAEAGLGEYTIFDRLLIDKLVQEKHVSQEMLEHLGERTGFLEGLLGNLNGHWRSDADLYAIMLDTIHSLAQEGKCILVGHGAAVVTQDLDNCFHFRLEATKAYRIDSLVRRLGLSTKDAKSKIEMGQKLRDRFIAKLLNCDLKDPQYYHLQLNNEKLSIQQMAKQITIFLMD